MKKEIPVKRIAVLCMVGIVLVVVGASLGSNYGKFQRIGDAAVDPGTGDIAFGYAERNGYVISVYGNDGTKKFSKRIDATGDVIRLCYRDGILYAKVGRENLLPAFDRSGEVVSYGQEPEGGFAYGTFDGWTQKNGDSSFRFGTTGNRYSESSVFVKCFAGKGVNRLYLVTESGEEIELFRDEGHS